MRALGALEDLRKWYLSLLVTALEVTWAQVGDKENVSTSPTLHWVPQTFMSHQVFPEASLL